MITATPTTPIHPINKTPIIMYFCRRMNCRRRRTPCWYCQRTSLTSLSSRILHKKTHEVVKIRLVIVDVEGLLVYVASGPFWIAELFIEETPRSSKLVSSSHRWRTPCLPCYHIFWYHIFILRQRLSAKSVCQRTFLNSRALYKRNTQDH